MMKIPLVVLIISCFFFVSDSLNSSNVPSNLRSLCQPDQKNTLLLFKHEFQIQEIASPYFIPKTQTWNEHQDCCSWDGVTCNEKSGLVIELDLIRSCLLGRFSSNSSLFRLRHLQRLDLSQNNFSLSSIPSEFSRLTKLTYLDLSSSEFAGQVPPELLHLTKLVYFSLGSTFPNVLFFEKLDWNVLVRNLSSLQELQFFNIIISSDLPDTIGDLKFLTALSLAGCNLSGSIPSSLGKLSKLTSLDLSGNKLNGFFPSSLLNLTELSSLTLSDNELKGKLPSNMNRLSKLIQFHASSNFLNGTLPPSLFMIPSLDWVTLRDNQLVGPLHFENASSFQLRGMDLARNNFNGSLPRSITKFVNLVVLDLSLQDTHCQTDLSLFTELKDLSTLSLAGHTLSIQNLPSGFNLPSLNILNLSSCNIGVFPNFLKPFPSLMVIDLFNNGIGGQIPRWLWQFPLLYYVDISFNRFSSFEAPYRFQTSLNHLKASNNNITGKISESICDMSLLKMLDLSNNQFSGSIPQCLGYLTGSLSVLSLQKNNLSGNLPQMCNNDSSLTTIDVGNNRLEGKLPGSLMKCGKLEFFNVESNQINDTFPFWMTNLPNLQVLVLRSNLFQGPIWRPDISFGFPKLRIIDVSHNAFTGDLPSTYFSNWTAISSTLVHNDSTPEYMEQVKENLYVINSYQDSISLMYKGNEMELKKISTILTAIDYSNNRLIGPIPDSISKLKALNFINLSGNAFTGLIPQSLINLTNLEALDLSRNQLSGEIPQDLGKLTSLAVINLSYNELTGGIPQNPQFQTQSSLSYAGNPGLCGLPLPNKCTPRQTVEAVDHSKEQEVFSWIAAAIAFVPAFVVAAIITHIGAYNKRWWVMKISGENRQRRTTGR